MLQNILPKSMMPEGITPSDRTLILLARLSRVENDPQKATALLEREIEHRNAQLPDARRDFTVTNADIDRVLASLGEEFSIQRASEVSSTPVPASHHAGRRANDFHHSDGSPLQDRERSQGNEPVSQKMPETLS